jgi:elongation factor G
MDPPRPILSLAIEPIDPLDLPHLGTALADLAFTDPTFRCHTNSSSGATILCGSSQAHLRQICHRLEHEYLIPLDAGTPQVVYLETIRAVSEGEGKYIRQTGGSGNYGHVKLRLDPAPSGSGIVFASTVEAAIVPDEYLAPIEEGMREAARGGILAGHEATDFRVTLCDGSCHETDSNPMAFRIAASLAFREAARQAKPVVMEPMMATVFTVDERELSAQIAAISEMQGRIEETSVEGGVAVVRVTVPLRAMLGYDGPAAHAMQFSGYEPVGWPPEADDAGAGLRQPRSPRPRTGPPAADPDVDWT